MRKVTVVFKIALYLLFLLPVSALAQTATINGGTVLQQIDGFGASSAFISAVPSGVINTEYNTSTGIGLKYIRTLIAPDYTDCVSAYGSCVSVASGATITTADLANVQTAVANGAVLMGSLWSPPGTMKDNGNYNAGGNFIGNSTNYTNLANAMASWVTLLNGTYHIPVYAVSVQNEPNVTETTYATCLWTAQQIHDYIPFLRSALNAAGFSSTKIMIAEPGHWGPTWTSYAATAMNDATVAGQVGLLAAHSYNPSTLSAMTYSNVTTQHQWETEVSDFNTYDGSMTSALTYAQQIYAMLTSAQINSWFYWLIANQRGDNQGLTDASYNIAKRAYMMGQWARFVTGMNEIAATGNPQSGVFITAFKNTSTGAFAIVAINTGSSVSQPFSLTGGISASSVTPYLTDATHNIASQSPITITSNAFTATLAASSVMTFVSTGTPQAATPSISPNGGTFSSTQTVTLSDTTPGSSIFYTTDGSTPTPSSTLYTTPFPVATSLTVKALATASGFTNSAVASAAFTINSGSFPWTGLLTNARAIDWRQVGAPDCGSNPAVCPARTTICTTLGTPGQSPTFAQSVTAANIQSALLACPAGQTVLLNPGTYTMTQTIFGAGVATPSNVTLRGSGPTQTILKWTATSNNCSGLGPTAFCIYNGDAGTIQYSSNVYNWTGGYAQGTTSLTLGTAITGSLSNLKVGSLLMVNQLDQVNDNGNWWNCGVQPSGGTPGCTWGGNSNAWPNRGQNQTVRVTGISGNTITITPGLYAPEWSSGATPYALWSNNLPVTQFGLENLQINTQSIGDIQAQVAMMWAWDSWVRNVSFINNEATGGAARKHLQCLSCSHVTIRDSYFYGASPSSEAYGVDLMDGASDTLVENNIFQHIATGTILEDGVGNVFGFNYAVDNFYTGSGGAPNWQQCDGFHHNEGDAYDLWEGQEGICIANDDFHGTSFGMTVFRSYLNGRDPANTCPPSNPSCGTGPKLQFTAAINDMAFARYENVVANILGTSTYATQYQNVGAIVGSGSCPSVPWTIIYSLNYSNQNQQAWLTGSGCQPPPPVLDNDPLASASLMRWGNYDTVNAAVRTNSGETASTASVYPGLSSPSTTWSSYLSFYLGGKPTWWVFPSGNAATPWPAVGPDVTGGNIANVGGHAWHNPAANCYLNVLGGLVTGATGSLGSSFDANICYPTSPPPTTFTLTVSVAGTGSGTVTNTLNCATGTTTLASGSTVTCGSAAAGGSTFTGWSGGSCSGTGSCSFIITANSAVTANYALNSSAPTFSPVAGTYSSSQNVTISSTTGGAALCWTNDGTTPTGDNNGHCVHGTTYSGPVSVPNSLTLKAIATKAGNIDSAVGTAAYIINAATPTFLPVGGTYGSAQSVAISTTTPGATLYYTTDGSTPTTSSPVYSSPITVLVTTTVKAIATAPSFGQSPVGSATYTITPVGAPFNVQGSVFYQGSVLNQ